MFQPQQAFAARQLQQLDLNSLIHGVKRIISKSEKLQHSVQGGGGSGAKFDVHAEGGRFKPCFVQFEDRGRRMQGGNADRFENLVVERDGNFFCWQRGAKFNFQIPADDRRASKGRTIQRIGKLPPHFAHGNKQEAAAQGKPAASIENFHNRQVTVTARRGKQEKSGRVARRFGTH